MLDYTIPTFAGFMMVVMIVVFMPVYGNNFA